jgi:TonB family protein
LVLNQPKPKVKEEKKGDAGAAVKQDEIKEKEAAAEEKEKPKQESLEDRQQRREETRQQREAKREVVKQQVRSAGIFAAITATGSSGGTGSSGAVSDLLSAAGGVGDLGSIDVSKGSFATKNVTAEQLEQRRGERTTGIGIEKSSVGTASGGQIASSGEVHISTQPPEMKSESGGAVAGKSCIQEAINRESHRIKRVYENWLKRDPSLSGQLKVRFVITSSGTVSEVSVVNSTTSSAEFDENIVRYIKRWDFSSCGTGESIEIVFPFVFSGTS